MSARTRFGVWVLASFLIGSAVGIAIAGLLYAENRVERVEQDRLPESQARIEEIRQLLGECELPEDLSDEASCVEWLSNYLCEHSDLEIEVTPETPFGKPDILVENALAIELKLELEDKADQDRCVGQCIGYAREWDTILVLIDTSRRHGDRLNALLNERKSEDIPIIKLSTSDS